MRKGRARKWRLDMQSKISEKAKTYLEEHLKKRHWKQAVTILACVVVFCTTYALILPALTMTGDTFCQKEVHQHSEECYEGAEKTLVCQLEEHEHTLSCYSNPEADVETASAWESTVPEKLGEDWAENLVLVAQSQLDYTESTDNYEVDENNNIHGYTRYGAWYGTPYGSWSATFVSFCLEYAGIPQSAVPYADDCASWAEKLESAGLYRSGADYFPELGDILFTDTDGDGAADQAGIVTSATGSSDDFSINTIAGDIGGAVAVCSYSGTDSSVLGYCSLPKNPAAVSTVDETAAVTKVSVSDSDGEQSNTAEIIASKKNTDTVEDIDTTESKEHVSDSDAVNTVSANENDVQLAASEIMTDGGSITVGESKTLSVGSGEIVQLKFVPEYSHEYTFYSSAGSNPDPYGYLYDADGNQLASNDDGAGSRQFKVTYYLEAGKTYYWGAKWLSTSTSVDLPVTLVLGEHEYSADESGQLVCVCGDTKSPTGSCGDNLTWSYDITTGNLTISGTGDMTDYTSSGNAPWSCFSKYIKSLSIEEGVTSVGDYAFYNHASLENVSFPNSLTDAGAYTFSGCSALKAADLSNTGVTDIRICAFQNCNSLETVSFPDTLTAIASRAFYQNRALKKVDLSGTQVTSVGEYAFRYCRGMESASFPDTLTTLGNYVFDSCTNLTEIDLSGTQLTAIGICAISSCSALKKVTLPATLERLENYAFSSCSALTDINLQETKVSYIGGSVFNGCRALRRVFLPECVSYLGSYAFGSCSMLEEIDLSNTEITAIPSYCFNNCTALKNVVFPSELTSLGDYAFQNCTGLTEITIPSTVTSVGDRVFSGSDGVTEIRVEAKEIKSFSSNQQPTGGEFHVSIADTVEKLSAATMTGLGKLGCTGISFEGPSYLTTDGWQVDFLPERLNVVPEGQYYVDANGVLYQIDEATGTASVFYCPSNLTSCEIPKELPASEEGGAVIPVIGVGSLAFSNAISLTSLTFEAPEQITTLNTQAFSRASQLASINGKGTASEVLGTFTASGLKTGAMLFLQTKITDRSNTLTKDALVIEKENLTLTISTQASKNRTPALSEEGTYQYYTGEAAQTTITVSNADSGVVADGTVIRVYFQYDSEDGNLNYKPGFYTVKSTSGKEYTMNVVLSDSDNCYYVELDRPEQGDTISILLNSSYPSPTSEGGNAMLWGGILTATEKEALGNGLLSVENYQGMNWTTKVDTFPVEKTQITSRSLELKGDGTGSAYISNLSYSIKMTRDGDTLEGMGKDYMSSVDFEDILTLPTGVTLAEDVRKAIEEGTVKITRVSSSGYYFKTAEERLFLTVGVNNASTNYQYLQKGKLSLNSDGNLVVSWRFTNSNLTTEMDALTFTYSISDETLIVENPQESVTYQMENQVTATQHFMYSEDQVQRDDCQAKVNKASSSLELNKTRKDSAGSYMGEALAYHITASNPGALPYQSLAFLNDDLPVRLYMDAADIANTFAEDTGKQLTLTIKDATLCEPKTGEGIKGINGSTGNTSLQNTGNHTDYSGVSGTDPDKKSTSQIVISWQADDSLLFTVDGSSTYTCEASETAIQALLQQLGFLVTSNTQYCLRWDLRDADGNIVALPGGGKTEKDVYCTRKDSFMLLGSDTTNQYPTEYISDYNYVYAKNESESILRNTNAYTPIYREFYLSKDWSKGGNPIDDETTLQQGDVLTYTLGVEHKGSGQYDTLPLVDHMTGTQALLVPVEKNSGADWTAGLNTVTEEGVEYYVLSKAGTYKNVWTNTEQLADSVVVTETGSGLDTLMKWYFVNYAGARTDNIAYRSYVCPDETGGGSLSYSLNNESWLSDHQSHRLYASLPGWTGTTFEFDKVIVDTPTNSAAGYRYSSIREGQSVYYRLSLTSSKDASGTDQLTTITGADMKDVLPASIAAAAWSKSNIAITYDTDTCTVNNGDNWEVAGTAGDETDPQYIKWADNFSISFTGTTYIYVTLTFPTGEVWKEYGEKYGTKSLTNSFYVLNAQRSVSHELAIEGQARLQKGVYDTGYFYNTGTNAYLRDMTITDGRLYYQNNDSRIRGVRYYVTLYNAGSTRLYLTEMQDILPRGFTYIGEASFNTSYSATSNTMKKEDGSSATRRYANVSVTTSTDGSGHQHIGFSFSKYSSSSVAYDESRRLCYLEPGEYIDFYYVCKTNEEADTDDAAVNIVTMPYYDYNNGGLRIDDGYSVKSFLSDTYTPNDGGCEVFGNAEVESLGFTGKTAGTSWLTSRVTVTRGNIKPGITKALSSKTDQNDVTTQNPLSAGNKDILNWSIRTENDGTSSMVDYALTDSMQSPYMFTGKVTYEIYKSSASDSSIVAKPDKDYLFTVEKGSAEDEWLITTNKDVSYTLKTGDEPIALSCKWYYNIRSGFGMMFNKDVDVWISIAKDEKENGVLSLRFPDSAMGIPEGGNSVLKLSTYNTSDSLVNKLFVNSCFVTPLSQTWDNTTNKGNVTTLATPYSNGESSSVRNSAPITVAYGYVTGASKSVTEKENTSNTAKCTDDTNYIVLKSNTSLFQYTLAVENSTPTAMEKLVMIDGLPEINDHTAFLADDPRFSEFKVSLADDPEFTLTVTDKDGNVTTLDSTSYTIEYSTATEFTSEDWSGSSSWSSEKTGARSIRLKVLDTTGTLIPAESTIALTFTCQIDGSDVQPGQIAWNSFGYHYRLKGQSADLESAPLLVGVKTPSVPKLRKQIVDFNGQARTTDSDASFNFLVYQGDALSGTYATEAELIAALGTTPYDKFTVTVKSGESLSDSVSLQTGKWTWTKGQKYTIVELPGSEDFAFKRFSGSTSSTYTLTYDSSQTQVITCENTNLRWNVTVKKENTSHEALGGAIFALYSPNSADGLSAVPTGYEGKAALTLEYNSQTWYLKEIGTTPDSGELTWSNLQREAYYLLEIQAPAGYNLNSPAGQLVRRENESKGICTVTVVNRAGYSLPITGGRGDLVYATGALLLCGAGFLLLRYQKHKNQF